MNFNFCLFLYANRSVEPSNNYTAIIPVTSIGIPEAVILDWDYQSSVVNPFSWRIVAPRVYIEYIRVESLDYNLRLVRHIFLETPR